MTDFKTILTNYSGTIFTGSPASIFPLNQELLSSLIDLENKCRSLINSFYTITQRTQVLDYPDPVVEIEASRDPLYFFAVFYLAASGLIIKPVKQLTKPAGKHSITYEGITIALSESLSFQASSSTCKGALLINSSGTTGKPKNILLDIGKYIEASTNFGDLLWAEKHVVHNFFPSDYMASLFNMFLVPLIRSDHIYIHDVFSVSFIPSLLSSMKRHQTLSSERIPSIFYFSPAMTDILINFSSRSPSQSIRGNNKFISTGSVLTERQRRQFETIFNQPLYNCYGVTELYGSISIDKDCYSSRPSLGTVRKDISFKVSQAGTQTFRLLALSNLVYEGYLTNSGFETNRSTLYDTSDYLQCNSSLNSLLAAAHDSETYHGFTCFPADVIFNFLEDATFVGRQGDFIKSQSELISSLPISSLASEIFKVRSRALNIVHPEHGLLVVLALEDPSKLIDIQFFVTTIRRDYGAKYVPHIILSTKTFPVTSIGKIKEQPLLELLANAIFASSTECSVLWKSPSLS